MSLPTIIAYVITALATFFSITSIPQVIVGGLLVRFLGREFLLVASIIGSVVTWLFVSYLWRILEGGTIPLAVLILAICLVIVHGQTEKSKLNQGAKIIMAAEMWGIIIVGIAVGYFAPTVRWY